jgi:hypothetical protein
MDLDYFRKILSSYRKLEPKEWGLRCARGALSGVPVVGGLLSEAISPAIEGLATAETNTPRSQRDIIIAAGTFDPDNQIMTGYGLISGSDNGVGDYSFTLSAPCKDYIVIPQIDGATFDITTQGPSGFRIKVLNRTNPKIMIDRLVKFLVLDASG